MRQTTSNGITIKYADAIGFAFMPCLIIASGSNVASLEATIKRDTKAHTYSVEAFKNGCVMDYREYVQALFDGLDFGSVNYSAKSQQGKTGADISVSVIVRNASGSTLATFSFTTFYVWGAMRPNETWNGYKRLVWFKNYPFSFGFFAAAQTSILLGFDAVPNRYVDVTSKGIVEVMANNLPRNAKYSIIYSYDDTIQQATFTNVFDLTFYLKSGNQKEVMRIDYDDSDEGIYLRWIDRHGFYRYWLFKAGDEERAISSEKSFIRNNLGEYQDIYAYMGANGRRQGYEREDTIPLCAPLVDSDTFDLLQDLSSSPVVDMYLGNGKWQSATIKAGSYTKTKEPLQDFVCNLVLNNTNIQQL